MVIRKKVDGSEESGVGTTVTFWFLVTTRMLDGGDVRIGLDVPLWGRGRPEQVHHRILSRRTIVATVLASHALMRQERSRSVGSLVLGWNRL